ncbi:unnamed protein product [Adineta steineri]|uniref:Uncharacterized protein n=1 Tax=Adineta steineri TaxID=433720 RepID=A0A820PCY2_9BILA|nr:unnamed protein product [Adineta steineri]
MFSLVLKSQKDCLEIVSVSNDDPLVDGFNEYYRPNELTVFEEKFEWHMDSTNKDIAYNYGNIREFTPFSVRENKQRKTITIDTGVDDGKHASCAILAYCS